MAAGLMWLEFRETKYLVATGKFLFLMEPVASRVPKCCIGKNLFEVSKTVDMFWYHFFFFFLLWLTFTTLVFQDICIIEAEMKNTCFRASGRVRNFLFRWCGRPVTYNVYLHDSSKHSRTSRTFYFSFAFLETAIRFIV